MVLPSGRATVMGAVVGRAWRFGVSIARKCPVEPESAIAVGKLEEWARGPSSDNLETFNFSLEELLSKLGSCLTYS